MAREAIKHVMPEWVSLGHLGMIEVLVRGPSHPETHHDGLGAEVRGDGPSENLGQAEVGESVLQCGAACLGCVSVPPRIERESPTDLDARAERRVESGRAESDESDEWSDARCFDGPKAESVFLDFAGIRRGARVAFIARKRTRKMLHHTRICVERRERLQIGVSPGSKDKAIRSKEERHVRPLEEIGLPVSGQAALANALREPGVAP